MKVRLQKKTTYNEIRWGKNRAMRQAGKPKIFASVSPRKMSSKDRTGFNFDYTGKSIFGYHLKGYSTIKKG